MDSPIVFISSQGQCRVEYTKEIFEEEVKAISRTCDVCVFEPTTVNYMFWFIQEMSQHELPRAARESPMQENTYRKKKNEQMTGNLKIQRLQR